MNELENRLYGLPDWGYVIYRTTYTTESDTAFPHAIRYIEACLKGEFFTEVTQQPRYRNNDVPAYVWSKYQSTIIEDPTQFDGASLEMVRAHFEAWVNGQGKRDNFNKYRVCLIIDEESLQTLKDAPVENAENDDELRFVKALEAFPIVDSLDTFPGWMKCWTQTMWFLWENMGDGDEMRQLYDMIDGSPFEGVFGG
ncbi:hypothetical protein N7448_008191 [Penicillium atrosanguineum]|uniref:Uncharacterized protein n=1 Tax=Penicillium atrosanguineum TaxID=1132637 RepID=A0A9W9QCB5_9EURO|nr:uncharacterized protein N7443_000794 [Penicillium atrosanguineum]KAJ5127412.1 hypothetical protein N7448_008191 [Penicillium atrosanguineum]KAJ5147615.1 hypothetical protein N7526_000967 [Penicillium atrosanguineum]KAJ5313910.1 hypothetical protein N7443_000794 [Penicillium atrosanguineum]KAJ5331081.1 hypothetical protein N7476_000864 [Penicillium atrosanguineum]